MTRINVRNPIRSFMRTIMRWKAIFDLFTLIVAGLLIASYWIPDQVRVTDELISYWFWVLGIFVGAREAGRWIGDHDPGKYLLRFIAHGEIYLILFLAIPFFMGVPEAFIKGEPTADELEVMVQATGLGLKVALLYAVSEVSKRLSKESKERIAKLSGLVDIVLGGQNKSPPT